MGKTDTLLNDLLRNFSPAKAADWLRSKFSYFDSSLQGELRVGVNKNEKTYFARAERLGLVTRLAESARSPGDRPLLVVAVEMTRDLTDRTSRAIQFNLCKRLLKEAAESPGWNLQGFLAQGIFFFYDVEGRFRISLVTGDVKNHRFQFNEARRQSFFVDPGAANNIVRRRLSEPLTTFTAVREAFSVEALTKEFYVKLFDWYSWAMNKKMKVSFPNDVTTDDDDRVNLSEALIRLITRLMFIWFVKQKNIVPAALFDVEALKDILKGFDPTSTEQNNYYRAILQNLFFATLNCQPARRRFVDKGMKGLSHQYGVKTCYRYKDELKDPTSFKDSLMAGIPFLNCALFDCLDRVADAKRGTPETLLDGFSKTKKRQAHLPNVLFFHPERGLVTLFNLFEFTVDENNADDSDIALDPELLGKVFENLLSAFNPETQETARKATGSFYTPREIVDYMVAESLRAYLKTKVPSLTPEQLDDLFDQTDAAERGKAVFDADLTDRLLDALYDCRILDPACGSGAFPMGILHCMVRLFAKLDPGKTKQQLRLLKRYEEDKKRVSDDMTPAEREDYLRTLKEQWEEGNLHADYARKLYIIENCIYGVDIQPIATQISKLRFFISLLCDQLRGNWDPTKENNGLLSLPNLEAKFVCANTLIPLPKVDGGELALTSDGVLELREKLQQNRHKIFGARSSEAKARWKAKDQDLRDQLRETVKAVVLTPDARRIAMCEKEIALLQKQRLAVAEPKLELVTRRVGETLFDEGREEIVTIDVNADKREAIDTAIAQRKREIAAERSKVHLMEADYHSDVEKLAAKVAAWDPYDQNASSDFFDAEWMFNIKDGFDIVIGNPPYGAKLDETTKSSLQLFYSTAKTVKGVKGSIDSFAVFTERGYRLVSIGGTAAFIIPMSFTSSDSMGQLHSLLLQNCSQLKISSYAVRPQPIFLDAVVNTCILMFSRSDKPCETVLTTKMYRKGENFNLDDLLRNLEFVNCKEFLTNGRILKIGRPIESDILTKILKLPRIMSLEKSGGRKIFYRSSGGRYFKVVTNYSTGSTKEKSLEFESSFSDVVGCCLSSNLSFWYYQIISNNLDWKASEIESFPIPVEKMNGEIIAKIKALYECYLKDIESNANTRVSSKGSSYKVDSFKEYKIGKSKSIIDEIDDLIGPLYGLTKEEIEFVKNYEILFRMSDSDEIQAQANVLLEKEKLLTKGVSKSTTGGVSRLRPVSPLSDDEYLE